MPKIGKHFSRSMTGFSAYSDMVRLNENTLGVIYETNDYKKIRFRRIKMDSR